MKKLLLFVLISFTCLIVLLSCSTTEKPKEEIKVEEVKLGANKKVIKLIRNPSRGYNFDGYIYIPSSTTKNSATHLLVIPYNGPKGTLSFQEQQARRCIEENSWQVKIAASIRCPLFMPVFPRDENISSQDLKYSAITSTGKTRRIDLQLINMIKDVIEYLGSSFNLSDKVLLAGASASGAFVSRFTILHPEIVHAVVSGLDSGLTMAPASRKGSDILEYPYGVFNFNFITGKKFNLDAFKKVNMVSMNGALDEDLTGGICCAMIYPYTREKLLGIYGDTILERCETTFEIFSKYTERFQSLLYENEGHHLVVQDAITFLNKNKGEEFVPITPSKPVVYNKNTASNSNQ